MINNMYHMTDFQQDSSNGKRYGKVKSSQLYLLHKFYSVFAKYNLKQYINNIRKSRLIYCWRKPRIKYKDTKPHQETDDINMFKNGYDIIISAYSLSILYKHVSLWLHTPYVCFFNTPVSSLVCNIIIIFSFRQKMINAVTFSKSRFLQLWKHFKTNIPVFYVSWVVVHL